MSARLRLTLLHLKLKIERSQRRDIVELQFAGSNIKASSMVFGGESLDQARKCFRGKRKEFDRLVRQKNANVTHRFSAMKIYRHEKALPAKSIVPQERIKPMATRRFGVEPAVGRVVNI